jgi:outer membrane protein assembly factor BamB
VLAPATAGLASTTVDLEKEWAQFQGSPSHLGAPTSTTAVDPPLKLAWRFTAPGEQHGLSGAVIVDGTAIAVGQNSVYGVDAQTGKLEWSRLRNDAGPIAMPAAGTAGGRRILVFTEGSNRSDAAVVAVDVDTREFLWRQSLKGVSGSGVTINGNRVLLGDRTGHLYGFDLATGEPAEWSPKALGGGGIDAPPAAAGAEVYVVTRDKDTGDVRLAALKASTGSDDWDFSTAFAAGTGSAVTVQGDRVYFGMGVELKLHAVSALTGREIWAARTRSSYSPLAGPAFAGGVVYVMSTSTSESALYAFDAADGTKRWDFQFQEATIRSSPVIVGDTAYVGMDDGTIAAVDVRDGTEVWEGGTGSGNIGPLAVSGDELIASKRGRAGGLIALTHDPDGRLLRVESPSNLKFGHTLSGYALALLAVLLFVYAGARLGRRAVAGSGETTTDPDGEV